MDIWSEFSGSSCCGLLTKLIEIVAAHAIARMERRFSSVLTISSCSSMGSWFSVKSWIF